MAERSVNESTAGRGARRVSKRACFSLGALAALVSIVSLALAGCVIGPKPDEPGITGVIGDDSGLGDTGFNAGGDTGVVVNPGDAAADTSDQKNDGGGTGPATDGCGDAADAEVGDAIGCGDASPEAGDATDATDLTDATSAG